jgi:hypothetical protein
MGSIYQPAPSGERSSNRPFLIAAAVIIVVIVIVWAFARRAKPPAPTQLTEAAYASNLHISDLHLSTARNFVGAEITYLDGMIANTGTSSLTGAKVLCIFRNSLGESVDTPVAPMQIEAVTLGQTEFVPLANSPLAPNQNRPFRLTFEHVSADWNMGMPELRVVGATTK